MDIEGAFNTLEALPLFWVVAWTASITVLVATAVVWAALKVAGHDNTH